MLPTSRIMGKSWKILGEKLMTNPKCFSSFLVKSSSLQENKSLSSVYYTTDKFKNSFHTSAPLDKATVNVLHNLKQTHKAPKAALIFGFSGLIPFVAAPYLMVSSGVFMADVAQAQLCYGAVILSFIGGVRWGLTLPTGSSQGPDVYNLGYSVTPSLIAWGGLLLPSPLWGTLTVAGGLGLASYMDLRMWGYPSWYKGMRVCLTSVAIVSLLIGLLCRMLSEDQSLETTEEKQGLEIKADETSTPTESAIHTPD